jgi:hypothetical protein
VSLLEEALPEYDVNEVHSTWVDAPPAAVWAAVRNVTPPEIRLLAPLMALRALPGMVLRRRGLPVDTRAPVLDSFLAAGFTVLAERPGEELVVGGAGRFWVPVGSDGVRPVASAEEFAAFSEPGSVRTVMNFVVAPDGAGARVTTETRIAGTDAGGTRAFRRYWRAISVGSAVIRISWLNAIRRRAQRG